VVIIYNAIRDGLYDERKVDKITEKLAIKCLRLDPGNRIDVVFTDKDEANKDEASKAKRNTRWLTWSLSGARVESEQWYLVKPDSVVKQGVSDRDVNDSRTLNKDFKANNGCETADCTVTKTTWLSDVDTKKKVGSMVIWQGSNVDAGYLVRTGKAMFGVFAHSAHSSTAGFMFTPRQIRAQAVVLYQPKRMCESRCNLQSSLSWTPPLSE
jgi:hypothetical protein